RADVLRLARAAHAWRGEASVDEYARAAIELIANLSVYPTYLVGPGFLTEQDRRRLTRAFRDARKCADAPTTALSLLERAFFARPTAGDALRTALVMRVQQTSGPAAAKGVEDTALYSYIPLASRNEVGGTPGESLADVHARVHARNVARSRDWPTALLATNTHDTKRSADLRARLDTLTAMPDVWTRHVSRWRRLSRPHKRVVSGKPAPDTNSEYLYYQTLLGLWPA